MDSKPEKRDCSGCGKPGGWVILPKSVDPTQELRFHTGCAYVYARMDKAVKTGARLTEASEKTAQMFQKTLKRLRKKFKLSPEEYE